MEWNENYVSEKVFLFYNFNFQNDLLQVFTKIHKLKYNRTNQFRIISDSLFTTCDRITNTWFNFYILKSINKTICQLTNSNSTLFTIQIQRTLVRIMVCEGIRENSSPPATIKLSMKGKPWFDGQTNVVKHI